MRQDPNRYRPKVPSTLSPSYANIASLVGAAASPDRPSRKSDWRIQGAGDVRSIAPSDPEMKALSNGEIHDSSFRSTNGKSASTDRASRKDAWKFQDDGSVIPGSSENGDTQGLVDSMNKLTIDNTKTEGLARGRWLGPRPSSIGSAQSLLQPNSAYRPRVGAKNAYTSAASTASSTYVRKANQPRMEQAGSHEYIPFFTSEFEPGKIIRAQIHEEDYKGPPSKEPLSHGLASTVNATDKHHTMSHYGPIYSENRYMIVVAVFDTHYLALPLYTHQGSGLAHKTGKDEWVSVQDARCPGNCIQQSAHLPLHANFAKPGIPDLKAESAVHIAYPISQKYNLPVAHQGSLDPDDTTRLVTLFQAHMIKARASNARAIAGVMKEIATDTRALAMLLGEVIALCTRC